MARPFGQALLTGTPIGSPQIRGFKTNRLSVCFEATCCVPAQTLHLPTHRYFQFGFALSCTLTRYRRPYEVSVGSMAGLGENVADDEFQQPLLQRSQSLSTWRHIRRLPSHGLLPHRSCPRLVLHLNLGFTFGMMLLVSNYWN